MRTEVMEYYRLTKPLNRAGYYETAHHSQILKNVRGAILEGRIVALCGVIGSGKTVMLRRLQQQLKEENRITVSRSLTAEKHSVKLSTLVAALFYDLSPGKKIRVPTRTEDRERELQELVKKSKRPVALFIDDAHALKDDTLTGLKRLMDVIESDGGCLSVVLAGWPKLRNDLRRPKLEKSVCGPIPSPSTALPATSASTSSGCCRPARRIRRGPMGSSVPKRSICWPAGCGHPSRSNGI